MMIDRVKKMMLFLAGQTYRFERTVRPVNVLSSCAIHTCMVSAAG